MTVLRAARAGTLESSDISVSVWPADEGLTVALTSSVENQFGDEIRASIREVAQAMGVTCAVIEAVDRGALDCTIRARVETALERACREEDAK